MHIKFWMMLKTSLCRKSVSLSRRTLSVVCARRTLTSDILPRSKNQEIYLDALRDDRTKIVLGVGAAGTGKTVMAAHVALEKLLTKKIDKIILTRPTVNNGNDLGALPGTVHKKMDPWLRSIYDQLYKACPKQNIESFLKSEKIEICPLEYARGRSFENSFILADETQNCSISQLKMLLTRIGAGSEMALTGDLEQTDIRGVNGLENFVDLYEEHGDIDEIKVICFDENDVVRSEIVKKILKIYAGK